MKACIFDIKRFSIHDGPGIRVTVFFKGCMMSCWWCHNPEGISPEPEKYIKETKLDGKVICEDAMAGEWMSMEQVMTEIEKERIFMEESGGGVTFSGGEPLYQPEFLVAALKECRQRSIHTAVDTSGYAGENLIRQVAGHTDMFLYDLKLLDEKEHEKYTGISNRQILKNLEILVEMGAIIHIRIPVIPGINDKPEIVENMVRYLSCFPNIKNVDLLPYHYFARSKYQRFNRDNRLKDILKPDESVLSEMKLQYGNAGFNVKIGG